MILLHVTFSLADNCSQEKYYNTLKDEGIINKTLQEDGCIDYSFYYPADNNSDVFLLECWENEPKMMAHRTTDHYFRLQDIKKEYVLNTSVERYDL